MADLTPIPANDRSEEVSATLTKGAGAKRRRLRKLVNKAGWILLILAPLTFVIAALGYKLGIFGIGVSFGVLNTKLGPILLALCAIFGLASLGLAFIVKPRKGLMIGILGVLVPLLAFAKLGATQKAVYEKYPFIHDVTTDTQDPPVFGSVVLAEREATKDVNTTDYVGKKAPTFNANKEPTGEALVSALQSKSFPSIRPLILDGSREAVFNAALKTAKSNGWKIKEEDLETGRIDATDTTFWYGFKDDVTIRLREANGGGIIVDVRSLSRVGGSDIGKNAARVGAFLDTMSKAELAK